MTTTMSFTSVAWPVLRSGSSDPQVRTLQYLLRSRGHAIAADSAFGPKTLAAVRAFQGAAQLAVDGVVGPQTWGAVIVTVRQSSTGDAVRAVQWQPAVRHESPGLQIDGDFGPRTDEYVRSFQELLSMRFPADGIAIDGIVGPVTWRGFVAGIAGLD